MKTFNVISYESGRIRKKIQSDSYDDAVKKAEDQNINLDDNFIESSEETERSRKQQSRWWDLQTHYY